MNLNLLLTESELFVLSEQEQRKIKAHAEPMHGGFGGYAYEHH